MTLCAHKKPQLMVKSLTYLTYTEINDSEFVFHQVVSIVVAQSNQIEVAKTSGFEFDRLTLEMI